MTQRRWTMTVTLVCVSWLLTSLPYTGAADAATTGPGAPTRTNSTAAAGNDTGTREATTTPPANATAAPAAVASAAATPPQTERPARVAIPLSFVIEDKNFTADLDNPTSDAFRSLEKIVTFQLDQLFKSSTLRESYITSVVRRFWRSSVGVTSDLLFDTRLGTVSPDTVADAFLRGTGGGTRLGEMAVSGPIVPGVTNEFPSWSIALLALTSAILLLNIIFLLACAVWCCQRSRSSSYGGATELYLTGENTSYPLYDTHGSLNQSKTVISPYLENSGMTFTNKGMESGM